MNVWFATTERTCYVGDANDGLQYDRWCYDTPHGKYRVSVTGWCMFAIAVIDDFGNLVEVRDWLT